MKILFRILFSFLVYKKRLIPEIKNFLKYQFTMQTYREIRKIEINYLIGFLNKF